MESLSPLPISCLSVSGVQSKRGEPPFSMDANLLHISYEGNALEDPWMAPIEGMFTRSVSPEQVGLTPWSQHNGMQAVSHTHSQLYY